MRKITGLSAVLLALLGGLFATTLVASPASAARVPGCPGFGHMTSGAHPWFDYHSSRSGLVPDINRLICSAATGSTIEVKSWFLYDDGPAVATTVHDLWIMKHYHGVHVRTVLGSGKLKPYKHKLGWMDLSYCRNACGAPLVATRVSHAKWITISSLRKSSGGGSAVLSMSMNFSEQQYVQGQSGILIMRDQTVYHAFTSKFASYVRCWHGSCGRTVPEGGWTKGAHQVWMMPSKADPELQALQTVNCSHGGTIALMSLFLLRKGVADAMQADQKAGCRVYVLLEHPTKLLHTIRARCVLNHDKALIIRTPTENQVIAGSADATPSEVTGWDNQMLKLNGWVSTTYLKWFRYEYSLHGRYTAKAC